jgi:hypothetical protein
MPEVEEGAKREDVQDVRTALHCLCDCEDSQMRLHAGVSCCTTHLFATIEEANADEDDTGAQASGRVAPDGDCPETHGDGGI